MKKGFTLVELSIVLVIIGLLIGGILVAKSMIATSKVQSFVRQMQQIDMAVENFKTKYNGLPGDSSVMGCATNGNTCNNGIIESGQNYYYHFTGEIGSFWPSLQASGYDQSGPQYQANLYGNGAISLNNAAPNKYIPKAVLGTSGSSIIAFGDIVAGKNYYQVADFTGDNRGDGDWDDDGTSGPSLTSAEALAFDQKVDDGVANTGKVVAAWTETLEDYPNLIAPAYFTANYCWGATANVYHTASSAVECSIRIDMGALTGDTQ